MAPPNSRKEVQKFIGVINYYRDMCPMRSHRLVTLTKLTSINRNFKWKQVEQDAVEKIKRIIARDTLLTYSGFNEKIKIHTNASVFQLGAVLS